MRDARTERSRIDDPKEKERKRVFQRWMLFLIAILLLTLYTQRELLKEQLKSSLTHAEQTQALVDFHVAEQALASGDIFKFVEYGIGGIVSAMGHEQVAASIELPASETYPILVEDYTFDNGITSRVISPTDSSVDDWQKIIPHIKGTPIFEMSKLPPASDKISYQIVNIQDLQDLVNKSPNSITAVFRINDARRGSPGDVVKYNDQLTSPEDWERYSGNNGTLFILIDRFGSLSMRYGGDFEESQYVSIVPAIWPLNINKNTPEEFTNDYFRTALIADQMGQQDLESGTINSNELVYMWGMDVNGNSFMIRVPIEVLLSRTLLNNFRSYLAENEIVTLQASDTHYSALSGTPNEFYGSVSKTGANINTESPNPFALDQGYTPADRRGLLVDQLAVFTGDPNKYDLSTNAYYLVVLASQNTKISSRESEQILFSLYQSEDSISQPVELSKQIVTYEISQSEIVSLFHIPEESIPQLEEGEKFVYFAEIAYKSGVETKLNIGIERSNDQKRLFHSLITVTSPANSERIFLDPHAFGLSISQLEDPTTAIHQSLVSMMSRDTENIQYADIDISNLTEFTYFDRFEKKTWFELTTVELQDLFGDQARYFPALSSGQKYVYSIIIDSDHENEALLYVGIQIQSGDVPYFVGRVSADNIGADNLLIHVVGPYSTFDRIGSDQPSVQQLKRMLQPVLSVDGKLIPLRMEDFATEYDRVVELKKVPFNSDVLFSLLDSESQYRFQDVIVQNKDRIFAVTYGTPMSTTVDFIMYVQTAEGKFFYLHTFENIQISELISDSMSSFNFEQKKAFETVLQSGPYNRLFSINDLKEFDYVGDIERVGNPKLVSDFWIQFPELAQYFDQSLVMSDVYVQSGTVMDENYLVFTVLDENTNTYIGFASFWLSESNRTDGDSFISLFAYHEPLQNSAAMQGLIDMILSN